MLLILLLAIPTLAGILCFGMMGKSAKGLAFFSGLVTLFLAVYALMTRTEHGVIVMNNWIPALGATFSLHGNVPALLMVLLTALVYIFVFIAQINKDIANPSRFYGLMLLAQSGLIGVFLAHDLLLFYFFWELALIPVYFLASQWGNKNRVKAAFKFFVYTFLGSLLMLAGLIYLYQQTPDNSFNYASVLAAGAALPAYVQGILFLLFFIAFGIKMPIFPLHSWQASAYEQSATPVTIVLSALMVKMGLYATMKWLLPIFPSAVNQYGHIAMWLGVVSVIYGSLLAMVQTDLKRLVAYSSLAHVGLMIMGVYSGNEIGWQGAILQMFNHGITIAGLWLIIDMIEHRYGTRDRRELGGMAGAAPNIAIVLVIVSFASIALPLTNGFVGEFLLFMGVFQSTHPQHILLMVLAGLGIILGAIYMLNMVQDVAYGEKKSLVVSDMAPNEKLSLYLIVVLIFVLGIYPNLILNLL